MNKVSNLINFYNRPTKDIINDLVNSYSTYPFSFREMLKAHGNKIITSIVIVRSPISNILYHQIVNNLNSQFNLILKGKFTVYSPYILCLNLAG